MTSVGIAGVLNSILNFYGYLLIAYVILSWFPVGRGGIVTDVYRVLASVCEPYIGIFRRIVPAAGMGGVGIDFSPLIAFLVLRFLIQPALSALVGMLGL